MHMASSNTDREGEWIRRSQAGEQAAFQQIARLHSESLFRCALTLCRDRQFAEDVAQETLLETWRSIHRFDGRCRFSTWLYSILRHRFLKAVSRSSYRKLAELPSDAAAFVLPVDADPSLDLQRSEDAARIRLAVIALPEEHRNVIELRFFAEATLEDIAATLDIPIGTVKSRLHHGLEKLREQKIAVNFSTPSGESSSR